MNRFTDELLQILNFRQREHSVRGPCARAARHKVMTFGRVYGGGGAINTLLEIDPRDIKRLTKAEVVDINEE